MIIEQLEFAINDDPIPVTSTSEAEPCLVAAGGWCAPSDLRYNFDWFKKRTPEEIHADEIARLKDKNKALRKRLTKLEAALVKQVMG